MVAINGLEMARQVYYNLTPAQLVELACGRGEAVLTDSGALRVTTGKYTGRSPNDKFVVDTPAVHNDIAWGTNKPFDQEKFERLYHRMLAYLQNREVFVFDGFAGADEQHRITVRFINEFAWHNLFVHQLFVRPQGPVSDFAPDFQVICLPGFKAVPEIDGTNSEAFIILNFERRIVLIGGTHYAGEMKKSIFTVMNYLLPQKGILSMHCSANVGVKGDVALFFGLSGTGKTTLSADPNRRLIGDDEHGWNDNGVFNIEGGCYAKCIRLSRENEPQIWEAIRFGAVLENVVIDPVTRTPDYDSDEITENTRAAYPIDHIPNALIPGVAGHPKTIIFLTADAFGVLPPVAKLTKEQAMYHFLSGYTSKLAGTERGVTEPEATFSACFGAPFLPLSPLVYAKLLGEKLEKHNTSVFLINTGWSGGPYGIGKRMNIPYTRAMVTAAIEGLLDKVAYELDPVFNVYVPIECPGVPVDLLKPRNTWADKDAYDRQAQELARLFAKNFAKFSGNIPVEVVAAGPRTV
ncbi:Phosphoenolpyruvate carboxykinase (ATP) [Thermosinus carboxydivorans Nor1]|uniref:Phosphoenolpyruvate carboxykinase (ATP) n=1 Tax=Thermosinus carboxydivorans Nor1 TaxID=401526 RepID=A1HS49_9FIRM|nr:phosphoenolpyruvate carboxykinase (ATP) [Thermosinus carboxydivorans]EAX47114.1 Phosphoenolpyruvate carboxykinase (ATP) [Thermosinus carboxydivorans Nor1]